MLASIVPPALVGELPEIVSVFAPTAIVPAFKANVPDTDTDPARLIPDERFTVRLFNITAGKLAAPLPPIMIFVELPPVNVPAVVIPPKSKQETAKKDNPKSKVEKEKTSTNYPASKTVQDTLKQFPSDDSVTKKKADTRNLPNDITPLPNDSSTTPLPR